MELGLINLATLAGQGAQDGPVSCLHLTRVELQMTLFFFMLALEIKLQACSASSSH